MSSDAKRIAQVGSVDWMFAEYKGSKKYTKLPARTRSGYDRAMGDVSDYILKDGRRVTLLIGPEREGPRTVRG